MVMHRYFFIIFAMTLASTTLSAATTPIEKLRSRDAEPQTLEETDVELLIAYGSGAMPFIGLHIGDLNTGKVFYYAADRVFSPVHAVLLGRLPKQIVATIMPYQEWRLSAQRQFQGIKGYAILMAPEKKKRLLAELNTYSPGLYQFGKRNEVTAMRDILNRVFGNALVEFCERQDSITVQNRVTFRSLQRQRWADSVLDTVLIDLVLNHQADKDLPCYEQMTTVAQLLPKLANYVRYGLSHPNKRQENLFYFGDSRSIFAGKAFLPEAEKGKSNRLMIVMTVLSFVLLIFSVILHLSRGDKRVSAVVSRGLAIVAIFWLVLSALIAVLLLLNAWRAGPYWGLNMLSFFFWPIDIVIAFSFYYKCFILSDRVPWWRLGRGLLFAHAFSLMIYSLLRMRGMIEHNEYLVWAAAINNTILIFASTDVGRIGFSNKN